MDDYEYEVGGWPSKFYTIKSHRIRDYYHKIGDVFYWVPDRYSPAMWLTYGQYLKLYGLWVKGIYKRLEPNGA